MREVIIVKQQFSDGSWMYNIYDVNEQEIVDGFRKKWQAIECIKRTGMKRISTSVNVYYY